MSLFNKIKYKKNEALSQDKIKEYEENIKGDEIEDVMREVGEVARKPAQKTMIKLILGGLLIVSIVMFTLGVLKYNRLMDRRDALKAEVEELEAEIEELKYLIGISSDSNEYMIRVARKKLGLHFPDEIVYYNDINE